jgi:DNA (cytosine-5)-methyltransferase 1
MGSSSTTATVLKRFCTAYSCRPRNNKPSPQATELDVSLQRFNHIPDGGNRLDLPDHLKAPCWLGHDTGFLDAMGRMHWHKPSVTICTEFFKPKKGRYLHPYKNRAVIHHEAARLQGFPDDFQWCGSQIQIARQIGNAVPVPLAKALAAHLCNQLG